MVRMLAAATLGVLVLGGGVVSYVHASKDCNPNACAAIIDAECGGFSGKVRADCRVRIVKACKFGTITCVASPSGAFLDE